MPKAEHAAAVTRVARFLQIEPLLDRRPSQLSGGQRQRVAMGRALVRNPDVFLFDEPLSNLDAKPRAEMRVEIKRLHQNVKTTIVYVTHDQVEAMTLASKIAVMNEGRIQQFATPQVVYETPANTFVATFMGTQPMNPLPAQVERTGDRVEIRLRNAEGKNGVLPVSQSLSDHLGQNTGATLASGRKMSDHRARCLDVGERRSFHGSRSGYGASRAGNHRACRYRRRRGVRARGARSSAHSRD